MSQGAQVSAIPYLTRWDHGSQAAFGECQGRHCDEQHTEPQCGGHTARGSPCYKAQVGMH